MENILSSNIIYKSGNILESDCQCLVNPVNTVGVMGAGLALQFKRTYPHMFKMYKLNCDNALLQVNRIMFYRQRNDPGGKIICLFPTKAHWRENSKLEYIEGGLKAFVKYYPSWKIESVAFPKLGCGLGGLDWENHVRPLMEKYLLELPIVVEIYE